MRHNQDQYPVFVHCGNSVAVATLPEHCRTASLDTTVLSYDVMTVSEARAFIELARERPLEARARTIVLVSRQLSEAVQNTLLKILEEPPATTELHIVIPHIGMLLPTVRSRVQVLASEENEAELDTDVTAFLAATIPERINMIAVWQKDENEEVGRAVIHMVGQWLVANPDVATSSIRRAYQLVDTWYRLPGASRKMLLEELALTVPVIIAKTNET